MTSKEKRRSVSDNDDESNGGKIIKDFKDFLRSHECDKDNMTHTSLIKGCGRRYSFVGEDYQKFMDKYSHIVRMIKNKEIEYDLHFVERPSMSGVTYLFIDVDFDQKGSKRLYTKEHIKEIIEKTNLFVDNNFSVGESNLVSYVTEKPEPTKRSDGTFKDGFHIYYPDLPMKESYRYYVLDYLSGLMVKGEFLEGIAYKNDSSKIFDMSVVKNNGILMIGSKKEGGHPYELTHIYDMNVNDMEVIDDDCDIEDLIYALSNQRYDVDASVQANDDAIKEIERIYESYNGGNKKKEEKTKDTQTKSQTNNTTRESTTRESATKDNNKSKMKLRDIEMAREFVKILDIKRATDYNDWMRVGFALNAIDDSLYDAFVDFSKKNMSKYKEGKVTCEQIWKKAKDFEKFYTIGSLRHWARKDDPRGYYDIIRKFNDKVFGQAESGKHVDYANVVYELYKDRFVCVDITRKKWYEFQNHRWHLVQAGYTLEELVSGEVRDMMVMYCSMKLRDDVANNQKGYDRDYDTKKYQKMMKSIDNLGDVKFRENIVKACANKFYDNTFQEKLDANNYLLGFDNGVYDLKEMSFRDGLPSDYVSKTVGYEWKEFKGDEEVFTKINRFFSQVHVDKDMREYIMTFYASLLRGGSDQRVHIWTGGGGNGKSASIDIIKYMLGDYFGILPITVLTRKRGSSSNATPEFADKNGKRFLVMNESEFNDVIYVGQMKEYSGGDTIMARPLYGEPFEYKPQFKLVLTCNILPHIPASDDGTWRRLRVTPFESKFVDGNPKGEREFVKDNQLAEEFPKWKQPMMWLVITKYYQIYAEGVKQSELNSEDIKLNKDIEDKVCRFAIKEPAKIKQYTNNYKKDSDVYLEFFDENTIKTGDESDTESIMFLYEMFRSWYKNSYSDGNAPPKKSFVDYIKKAKIKMDKKNVYGLKHDVDNSEKRSK